MANAAAFTTQCCGIEHTDFNFFSRTIRMPRHGVVNAVALAILTSFYFSALMSMPRHWVLNAVALESRPK